jgi:hypothetical protein
MEHPNSPVPVCVSHNVNMGVQAVHLQIGHITHHMMDGLLIKQYTVSDLKAVSCEEVGLVCPMSELCWRLIALLPLPLLFISSLCAVQMKLPEAVSHIVWSLLLLLKYPSKICAVCVRKLVIVHVKRRENI